MEHFSHMQETHHFQQDLDYFNDGNIQELFFSIYYEEETTLQGTKIYRCTFSECRKIFRFKSEIARHIAIHSSNNRPFHCKHKGCSKSFKRLDALENHVRIHTKTKPFICNFSNCEQNFTTKAGLRYHLLKHKDKRSYKCTLKGCEKSFLTASHLRQHQKTSILHTKMSCDGSSNEENSDHTKPEEDHESQDGQTDSANFTLEEKYQKLLNRILEQNKKLAKRLELWHRHVQASKDIKETHTEKHCFQKEFESNFNRSEAGSFNTEFSKWENGCSC